MIRERSVALAASALAFTLLGCGMASVEPLKEPYEITVDFGAAGVASG